MAKRRVSKIIIAWWLAALEWLLVRYVNVDDKWLAAVREAASSGRVVFVLRNRSLIDLLCLRGLCERYDLPRISFVTGIPPFFYMPFWLWLFRLLVPTRLNELKRRFSIGLRSGGSAVVFLRRPAALGKSASRHTKVDGIRVAVETQATFKSSIIALPTVFLWGESAMKRFPGTMDFLFGSNEYPRLLRSIWLLIRRRSVHQLMVGEPLDLNAIHQERGLEGDALAGVARAGVGRQIEKIRRSRLGSLTKPSARVKSEVLSSPKLKRELYRITEDQGLSKSDVASRAQSIVNKLASDFQPRVLVTFAWVMSFVWRRIYTGIEVADEDMESMKKMVSMGPTLILPTHKSHIDYIAVSQVMRTHNMMLPHIAAGQNLSFWPLGWLFRSSGAFFIRRKFVSDPFYTAVVNAYIRRLVQEGYSIEVFIEGGRSRTGKLLRPKLGMLEMCIRTLHLSPRVNLGIVPVFIGYERVIEETSYVEESLGNQKTAESIKGLIKSTKVLMSRYGKLYVKVGDPFTVGDVLRDMGLTHGDLDKLSTRREVAMNVAKRNFSAVNRITVVTPSAVLATAILCHRGSIITHSELNEKGLWLARFFAEVGAPISDLVLKWNDSDSQQGRKVSYLDRTIAALVKSGRLATKTKGEGRSYAIRDSQRLPLDYYKNNTIHFLVPASLVCASLLIRNDGASTIDAIVSDMQLVTRFWAWEFMLSLESNGSLENESERAKKLVDTALAPLRRQGVVRETDNALKIVDRDKAILLLDAVRNMAETYFAVIATIRNKALGDVTGDTWGLSLALAQDKARSGEFTKPEAHSRLNVKNAIQAFKELKILRPAAGETPFDKGMIGDRIHQYLDSILNIE